MKKLIAALGPVLVVVALLVGPADALDVSTAASARVVITGTPASGSTVGVAAADWGTNPDTRAYEWLRDGEGDVLGRDRVYQLSQADVGHTMVVVERVWFGSRQDETSSVPVTVTGPVAAQPAPAAPAAPAAPVPAVATVNTRRPTLQGTLKVGRTLKVRSKGAWKPTPTAYSYQWLRNGKKISKATKSSYKLTKKDRTKKITVRVTAKRAGVPSVAASSKATKRVR